MQPKKVILILLLIIVVALAFRVPAVLNSGSFWFDEVVSLEIADKGIVDSWQYLQWENNPPLHYWWLKFWVKVFGESEVILRLSSVVVSVLSIIAIYFLGKRLAGKQAGLFAGFLLAISSYQLYLSADARMYPMLLLFGILSCYYFLLALDEVGKKVNWILYILFTVLAFYTHLTSLFLFIVQNLYFVYYYFNRRNLKLQNWIYSQGIILVLFLPWLYFFVVRTLVHFNSQAWYLNTVSKGFFIVQVPFSYVFAGKESAIVEMSALLMLGILLIVSIVKFFDWSGDNKEFRARLRLEPNIIFGLMLFLIPLLIGSLIQVWVAKYYMISAIGFYLLLAIGSSNLGIRDKQLKVLVVVVFLLSLPYNLAIIQNKNSHQWHQVADFVEAEGHEHDLILIPAFVYELPFRYYYKGDLEVAGYEPEGLEDDLLLKAVKYNWYPVLNKDNTPDMNEIVYGRNRVIVINPTVVAPIHNPYLAIDWLWDNDWTMVNKKRFGGFIQPEVLIFEFPGQ